MDGARIWILLPFSLRIPCDERPRREQANVRKLKAAALLPRHRLKGAHSEAAQEAPPVVGLSVPTHTVPLVGQTPAAAANYQVTHIVRAAQLWRRRGIEHAQIVSPARKVRAPHGSPRPPHSGSWGSGWHGSAAYGKPSSLSSMPAYDCPGIMLNAVVVRRKERRDDSLEICSRGSLRGARGCYFCRTAGILA